MLYISGLSELLKKEEEKSRLMDESVESLANYHPTLFRNGRDTCTLTALNTSTYDVFESPNSVFTVSKKYFYLKKMEFFKTHRLNYVLEFYKL